MAAADELRGAGVGEAAAADGNVAAGEAAVVSATAASAAGTPAAGGADAAYAVVGAATAGEDAAVAVVGVAATAVPAENGAAAPGAIVVVDYHKGNLSSVRRGLMRAGYGNVLISDEPAVIEAAAGVVLPGVGSFADAIAFMREAGQDKAILAAVGRGVPFLGICLGLQLLCERGDEGVAQEGEGHMWESGLGLLCGSCTRLDSARLKVPHVGWDQLHVSEAGRACPLLAGVPEGANVYFTHSYAVDADARADEVAAATHYVRSFPCVMWKGNVFGCQFHPEKSSATGLAILKNFVRIVEGTRA